MKKLFSAILMLSLIGCGAITRKEMMNQKIIIKDSETKKVIADVTVKIDGQVIGSTSKKGILRHQVSNPNEEESFQILVQHPNYQDINLEVTAQPGGGYIAGEVAFFLLGIVPGVVSLAVDGATGTWYTYEKKIVLNMNPK